MGQRQTVPEPPEEDCESWDTEDLLKLFESGDGSDFVLQCGNNKFSVHKEILSERSDVLDAMFQSSMDSPYLDITDVGASTLEEMLHFIYSGKMPAYRSVHYTMKLFDAGNKYQIEPLKKKCLNLIKKHITEDDACDILLFAENRKIGKLKDLVIPFLADKKPFLLSETFKIFYESHPELAIEVLIGFVRKTP